MPEPNSGCLLWLGQLNKRGYAVLGFNYKNIYAHRAAWTEKNGAIPDGLFVCHKCDVPACINPDHLFLGDHDANMRDKQKKGRAIKKLTEEQVASIRADDRSVRRIARDYGVSGPTIWLIKAGKRRLARPDY